MDLRCTDLSHRSFDLWAIGPLFVAKFDHLPHLRQAKLKRGPIHRWGKLGEFIGQNVHFPEEEQQVEATFELGGRVVGIMRTAP